MLFVTEEGTIVALYQEHPRKYQVEDLKEPMNEPICTMDNEFRNYVILANSLGPKTNEESMIRSQRNWKMHSDGAQLRSGASANIVFTSPQSDITSYAFRLEFETTNNVTK